MTENTESYDPSPVLRKLVLRAINQHNPVQTTTPQLLDSVESTIQHAVRGLISTLGLGLDARKSEVYTMTQNGLMKDEIKKCYLFRMPVLAHDAEQLCQAITEDLYRFAGEPCMEMASAKLVVQDMELVVIGKHSPKDRNANRAGRAKLIRIG